MHLNSTPPAGTGRDVSGGPFRPTSQVGCGHTRRPSPLSPRPRPRSRCERRRAMRLRVCCACGVLRGPIAYANLRLPASFADMKGREIGPVAGLPTRPTFTGSVMPMAMGAFILQASVGLRASVPALVASSGLFAKLILLLLLGISVYTWAIIVERLRLYVRVQREDRDCLAAFRAARGEDPPAERYPASVLSRLARVGERALAEPAGVGSTPSTRYDRAQRAMERAAGDELARLEQHVGFLATAGSVSPFIGLMGTVWGVMSAFLSIGAQGSASLVVVAPGIAEALITTVAGLAAAIPAVVGYNHLLTRLRVIHSTSSTFVTEYLDRRTGGPVA